MRNTSAIVLAVLCSFACKPEAPKMVRELRVEHVHADSLQAIAPLGDSLVRPILYRSLPSLSGLTVDETKSAFISAVLPAILVAKHQINLDRQRVLKLDSNRVWSADDSVFIAMKARQFGTEELSALASRMKTHPNSIILAQAIVESGWGSSRVFQNANNLFGIWSYRSSEPRILAGKKRDGQAIYLRRYSDIAESVMDYFGTVARTRAYRNFRAARRQTNDINTLLPHLKYYSERREEYVTQLRAIIRQNNLTTYDEYQIDPAYFIVKEIES